MEISQTLSALLSNPQAPADPAWVLAVTDRYPTFYLPALILLQRNPDDVDADTLERLHTIVALNCADREAVSEFIDIAGGDWANLYPAPTEPAKKSTDETIDDFISKYGHSSEEETAVLENLIFNPVPADYFADTDTPIDPDDPLALPPELMQKEPAPSPHSAPSAPSAPSIPSSPSSESSESIKTIESTESSETRETPPAPASDRPMMVSLAQMYIKQKKYSRAYEIISTLSLKFPEKSVYFADQLRFLRKLMLIQELENS